MYHGIYEFREIRDLFEGVFASCWHEDMNARCAGGFAEGIRSDCLQKIVRFLRCFNDRFELDVLRIQVENNVVGIVQRSDTRAPRMKLDASEVHHVKNLSLIHI